MRKVPARLALWTSTLGEVVFFTVVDDEAGLWRMDGTPAGTHRIYDGLPYWHFFVQPQATWNGLVYYPVITDVGTWLYRTDGTTPGTSQVAKISGWYGGAPCGDGKLCFGTTGNHVAVTDGTAAGTKELTSTAADDGSGEYREVLEMTAMGKRAYFNAYDDVSGLCMTVRAGLDERFVCGELWTTDGTVSGTHLVKDLLPGVLPGAPENLLASSAGKLYFAAADPADRQSARAWVSDGTAEGTRMLNAKPSDWAATPSFVEIAGRVFFTTSDEDLFETDGTPDGTHSLRDRFATKDLPLRVIDAIGRAVVLEASYPNRAELWSYEGTALAKLADVPYPLTYLGYLQSTRLGYFVSNNDVWSTDGTVSGTQPRFSVPATGATRFAMAVTPTHLYFGDEDKRYVTDGTKQGTYPIDLNLPVAISTGVQALKVVNGKVFFQSSSGAGSGVTDGTAAGTQILIDDNAQPFDHEGQTYIYRNGILWHTDGTRAGTMPATTWLGVPGLGAPPSFLGSGAAIASDNGHLVRRNPDATLRELGMTGNFATFVSVAGGVVTLESNQPRLVFTNGTAAGTRIVTSDFREIGRVVSLGTKVLFRGRKNGENTAKLWVTDLTPAGTQPLMASDDIVPLLTWRNHSIFRLGNVTGDLWQSDGTAEGTFRLDTGQFDAAVADGDELVLVRFTYPGYEVWTSDGTSQGTIRRDTYAEGDNAGEPFVMKGGGVGVIYAPNKDEIQIRNHRTKSVQAIQQVRTNRLDRGVGLDDLVFFAGFRGYSGYELFAVPLDGNIPASPPSSVSIEYRGTASTPTGLGAVFHVHLEASGEAPPSVLATTVDGTLTSDRDYIPFVREIVFESDQDATLIVPLRHHDANGTLSVILSSPVNATITQGLATAVVNGRRRVAGH